MAEWPCCHDPLRFSPMSLRFVPPSPSRSAAPRRLGREKCRVKDSGCWQPVGRRSAYWFMQVMAWTRGLDDVLFKVAKHGYLALRTR